MRNRLKLCLESSLGNERVISIDAGETEDEHKAACAILRKWYEQANGKVTDEVFETLLTKETYEPKTHGSPARSSGGSGKSA